MNKTDHLSLYRIDGCPWCDRVQAAIADLALDVEERDIRSHSQHAQDLRQAMGKGTVPVLRIDSAEGSDWVHESADIVRYLYSQYGDGGKPVFLASNLPQRLGTIAGIILLLSSLFTPDEIRLWIMIAAAGVWLLGNRAPHFWKWL